MSMLSSTKVNVEMNVFRDADNGAHKVVKALAEEAFKRFGMRVCVMSAHINKNGATCVSK